LQPWLRNGGFHFINKSAPSATIIARSSLASALRELADGQARVLLHASVAGEWA
jgi:hypothetical protein